MNLNDFRYELTPRQKENLEHFSDWGVERYERNRRKGMSRADAFASALAWAQNTAEQAERRCAHDTGADRRVMWRNIH